MNEVGKWKKQEEKAMFGAEARQTARQALPKTTTIMAHCFAYYKKKEMAQTSNIFSHSDERTSETDTHPTEREAKRGKEGHCALSANNAMNTTSS